MFPCTGHSLVLHREKFLSEIIVLAIDKVKKPLLNPQMICTVAVAVLKILSVVALQRISCLLLIDLL